MSNLKNICTKEADRERLLKALRKLHEAGVTLIDDQAGRPNVISMEKANRAALAPISPTKTLILDHLDSMFEIEDNNAIDPYNHKL